MCNTTDRRDDSPNQFLRLCAFMVFSGFAAFRAVRLRLTGTSIYSEAMPLREIRGAASISETANRKGRAFPHGRRQSRKDYHRISANFLFY
jgi:hypothetical protein